MIKRIDRPVVRAYLVCGFFFLAWGNKLCQLSTGGHQGETDTAVDNREQELMSWTGRVCHALFYVCIALKIIWFPFR